LARQLTLPGDSSGLRWLHEAYLHHRLLHDAVDAFETPGVAIVLVALVGGAVVLAVRRRSAAVVLVACAAAYVVAHLLKPTVDRAVPYLHGRVLHGQHPGGSFPETPGAIAVALAIGLWDDARPLALAALAFAVVDGLAQVARASHWPSDILAGWALGAALGLLSRAARARGFGGPSAGRAAARR
jgi:membrane-associated phospholipid phosphatase